MQLQQLTHPYLNTHNVYFQPLQSTILARAYTTPTSFVQAVMPLQTLNMDIEQIDFLMVQELQLLEIANLLNKINLN